MPLLYTTGVWLWGAAGYLSGLAVPQVNIRQCVPLLYDADFTGWCTSQVLEAEYCADKRVLGKPVVHQQLSLGHSLVHGLAVPQAGAPSQVPEAPTH